MPYKIWLSTVCDSLIPTYHRSIANLILSNASTDERMVSVYMPRNELEFYTLIDNHRGFLPALCMAWNDLPPDVQAGHNKPAQKPCDISGEKMWMTPVRKMSNMLTSLSVKEYERREGKVVHIIDGVAFETAAK